MNCLASINITKELGFYRSVLLSFLFGLLSFVFLYLPITLVHSNVVVIDPGFIPIVLGVILLPLTHKFFRILPILLFKKQIKLNTKQKRVFLPFFYFSDRSQANKYMVCLALLTPTFFITCPLIAGSYLLPAYYPFFVLGAAINLSLSYIDFLSLRQLWKAPKKSIISKDKGNYDILIQR